jgi:blue copper oxidase
VIVQDRDFNADGSFRYVSEYAGVIQGIQGDTILVNGTVSPHFVATTRTVRLRMLNASNARTYTFAFADERAFTQISSDGGLLEQPLAAQSDDPGAGRARRHSGGCQRRPRGDADQPRHGVELSRVSGRHERVAALHGYAQSFEILAIRPQSALAPSPVIPAQLAAIARLDPGAAVTTRQVNLMMGHGMRSGEDNGPHAGLRTGFGGGFGGGNYSINGRHHNMAFVNERVPMGDIEIWELHNTSPLTHPVHIHNVHFQVLDRNGVPPPPEERGLKDTVRVLPGETVRVLCRFEHYRDPETPYMYHCHMLEHEDRGMMAQFVVV